MVVVLNNPNVCALLRLSALKKLVSDKDKALSIGLGEKTVTFGKKLTRQ